MQATQYRLGRYINIFGLFIYIKEDTPSALLNPVVEIEKFLVELSLRKRNSYYFIPIIHVDTRYQIIEKKFEETWMPCLQLTKIWLALMLKQMSNT